MSYHNHTSVPTSSAVQGMRVRIPPAARISVFCECCVLSGRGLCDGPITRTEESYRVVCVCVTYCDHVQKYPLHLQWVGRRCLNKKKVKLRNKVLCVSHTHIPNYIQTPCIGLALFFLVYLMMFPESQAILVCRRRFVCIDSYASKKVLLTVLAHVA
jgi:hypothetical protein